MISKGSIIPKHFYVNTCVYFIIFFLIQILGLYSGAEGADIGAFRFFSAR
jgi:hypothetical protein